MPTRDQLGKLLLRQKLVAPAELARALSEQEQSGGRLGAILVRRGSVPEDELVRVLAAQLKLPVARIRGKTVKAEVLELVPAQLAEKYRCLPLFRRREEGGSVLVLALEDPSDRAALDELAFQLGERLQPVLIRPTELEDAIQRHYYAETLSPSSDALPPRSRMLPPRPPEEDTETAPELPPADPLLHPAPAALRRQPADTEDTAPELAEPEPAAAGAGASDPGVVLRALSQLLVEKGVIDRDELVERVRALAARSA